MAINIGANFAYQGKQPNFARDSFATKAAMKAFAETSIDEGHLSYCAEDGNMYQFKSTNSPDNTTGRWRIFKSGNQVAVTVDSALSSTSTNPVQNKIIKTELDKKMPKGGADYIATGDLTSLPITEGVIDLNGYTLNMSNIYNGEVETLTIINGTINFSENLKSITIETGNFILQDISITAASFNGTLKLDIGAFICINVISTEDNTGLNNITKGSIISDVMLYNSVFKHSIPVTNTILMHNSYAGFKKTNTNDVTLTAYGSIFLNDGLSLAEGSSWRNSSNDLYNTPSGHIDENGKCIVDIEYDTDIANTTISDNAPTTKAVYDALQLKADKTQLSSYVTTTTANNTYLSKTDASKTYAKKTDISSVYKFKGSVKTYGNLPTENMAVGDTYNIEAADSSHGVKAGDNLAWNGSAWDNLSGTVDLSAYATTAAMNTALRKKVDIVSGKGLSTNDFTNDYKTKLDNAFHTYTTTSQPGEFVAGPATTKGNLALRKILPDDLPVMGAATASAAGKSGIVPAPAAGKQLSFLRGDGTWVVPTDTKYTLPTASTTLKGGVIVGTNLSINSAGKLSVSTSTTVGKGDTKPVTSDAVSSAINGVSVGLSSCLNRVAALEKSTTNIANGAVYMGIATPTAAGTAELKPAYKCYYLINSAGNYSQFGSEFTEAKLTDYFNAGMQITAYWDGKSWSLGDAGMSSAFLYVLGGELSKYVPLENTEGDTTIKAPNVTISSTAGGGKTTISGYGVAISSDMDDLTITLGTGHKATINGKKIATVDLINTLTAKVNSLQTSLTALQNTVNAQPKQVVLTQSAYDALTTKDSNTIYYING